jgi:hypothetical protein
MLDDYLSQDVTLKNLRQKFCNHRADSKPIEKSRANADLEKRDNELRQKCPSNMCFTFTRAAIVRRKFTIGMISCLPV